MYIPCGRGAVFIFYPLTFCCLGTPIQNKFYYIILFSHEKAKYDVSCRVKILPLLRFGTALFRQEGYILCVDLFVYYSPLLTFFFPNRQITEDSTKGSKATLVYGQMNEPPGARARVALTGLTIAEVSIPLPLPQKRLL